MNEQDNQQKELMRERLKSLRQSKNLKLEDVAKILGIAKGNYWYYESGKTHRLPVDRLMILANYYNVSPAWLAGFDVPSLRQTDEESNLVNEISTMLKGCKLDKLKEIKSIVEVMTKNGK